METRRKLSMRSYYYMSRILVPFKLRCSMENQRKLKTSDSRATHKSLKLVSVCNFFHTPNYFLNNCWRVREILSGKSPSFSRTAVEKGIKDVIRPVAFFSFDQLQYLELQLPSQCGDVISFSQHNSVSSM